MSQSASQAHAFYKEVGKTQVLYTLKDDRGFPAPITSSGRRAQPFWSSRSRVERIQSYAPAYSEFQVFEVSWNDFCRDFIPSFEHADLLVGVNWSGKNVTGYDLEPADVKKAVESYREIDV